MAARSEGVDLDVSRRVVLMGRVVLAKAFMRRNDVKKHGMYTSSPWRDGGCSSAGVDGIGPLRDARACSTPIVPPPDCAWCTKTATALVGFIAIWHGRFVFLQLAQGAPPSHYPTHQQKAV